MVGVISINKKRKAIWDKSNGHCWYCGCELGERGWHADHFVPVKRRFWEKGSPMEHEELDTEENLVPACASCNILKGSVSIESFRKYVEGLVNSLENNINQYKIAERYGMVKVVKRDIKFWFEENGFE